ncbi:hypothetical protein [Streptomyces sp. MBT62]|uniref:hypothetical protein n=1 Tax=Streptomyces sp. MBT62 TaxID=2800410 RepID=UPI00190A851A|nr:hypothetical protein [Streptomyces sp. MBT62]MBK3567058.1 hypothetical protein [Streptomyces sp. MBT62]
MTARDHFTAPPPRRLGALGIIRNSAGAVLMIEKGHPTHLSKEDVNFLFDCGVIDEHTPFVFGGRIQGTRWMLPDELDEHLTPFTAARTHAALRALSGGHVEVLAGHPL